MIKVHNKETKRQTNFWTDVLFHPTDAVEDPWGKRILDTLAEDRVPRFVRIYAMLEDIVYLDPEGNLSYDFRLSDLRLDYLVEKGVPFRDAHHVSGALVATAGCVLPSCVIALLLAWVYYRYRSLSVIQGVLGGVRPAVVAMIASAGLSILLLALFGSEVINLSLLDLRALGIFALALAALRIFKPDPIWVMAGAGVLGGILYSL